MVYNNPLHAPVMSSQYSGYSALNGAVSDRSAGPSRKRLHQPPYTPSSKWHNTIGRSSTIHSGISFDYKGYSRQGVSMRDLSTRNLPVLSSMMAGGEDRVFAQSGLTRITFRILWPGYSVEWARSIELTSEGPITRAHLAQVVAQNFSRFIDVHRKDKTSVPEFAISLTNLRFDHLVLVSLNNVFEDSWQADVIIDLHYLFILFYLIHFGTLDYIYGGHHLEITIASAHF